MNLPIHPVNRIREAKNLRSELGFTLRLGGPLALGELGWMSTYIVDALMIGRLSNSPLAISASSLGNTIFYAIVFCAIYLMNGLETLIAQAYGQADETEGVLLLAQSFWLVLVGTPLVMVLSLGALWLLPHMGTPPEIVAETTRYLKPLVWSTAPLLTYMALRKYLQSIVWALRLQADGSSWVSMGYFGRQILDARSSDTWNMAGCAAAACSMGLEHAAPGCPASKSPSGYRLAEWAGKLDRTECIHFYVYSVRAARNNSACGAPGGLGS
jgi:hypothetical protein